MKQKGIFIVMVAMMMITSCATQQQKAERKAEMQKAVTEAIASKKLHIDIKSMNTLRYGVKTVTPDFFLELRGDTLQSYLPYLGRAYQGPMHSPSIGLNFETCVRSISETRPKSNRSRFEIGVKTEEDSYQYVVEVYDTGQANIRVSSQHRDPISYDGEVVTTNFRR
jgi:hypothetical protein